MGFSGKIPEKFYGPEKPMRKNVGHAEKRWSMRKNAGKTPEKSIRFSAKKMALLRHS